MSSIAGAAHVLSWCLWRCAFEVLPPIVWTRLLDSPASSVAEERFGLQQYSPAADLSRRPTLRQCGDLFNETTVYDDRVVSYIKVLV